MCNTLSSRISGIPVAPKHYALCIEAKRATLLEGVTATFKSHRMCALLGCSGAGKSTLLDVIAGYKTHGTVVGKVYVDGSPKCSITWRKIAGYAEQQDILQPYLSVQETLTYAARFKLAGEHDVAQRVAEIMSLMNLVPYANVMVGHEEFDEGLAKQVRRRLTISLAVLSRPRILLLDEPTTGLDSLSSTHVVTCIRRACTNMGLVVVATIHQPSNLTFKAFDDTLVLDRGGKVAYFGPTDQVVDYFRDLCPKVYYEKYMSSADYVLRATQSLNGSAPENYLASSRCANTSLEVEHLLEECVGTTPNRTRDRPGFLKQAYWLTRRQVLSQWRNPTYSSARILVNLIAALLLGFLFFNIPSTLDGAISAIAAIFYAVFTLVIAMQSCVIPVVQERAVFYREAKEGYYHRSSYGLALVFSDLPFNLANGLIFALPFYFIVGLRSGPEYIGYFLLMYVAATWLIPSLGQLFAFISPNTEIANGLAGLSVVLSVLLMGFLVAYDSMPKGWQWANWANAFRYVLQGLCVNELGGRHYTMPVHMGDWDLPGVITRPKDVGLAKDYVQGATTLASLAHKAGMDLRQNFTGDLTNQATVLLLRCLLQSKSFATPFDPAAFLEKMERSCEAPLASALGTISGLSKCSALDGEARVLCMLRAMLPDGKLSTIMNAVSELLKFLAGLVDDIKDGYIDIPGNLILYYFGWASLDGGVGDLKWYYCLFAVAVFLVGIELIKQLAIVTISWIRR